MKKQTYAEQLNECKGLLAKYRLQKMQLMQGVISSAHIRAVQLNIDKQEAKINQLNNLLKPIGK